MRNMKNLVMVGLVLAVGAMTVQAAYIDQDFDGLTLGDYSDGDEASLGPARYVTGTIAVVDDGPFAGAGNQSMRISDGASGDGRIQYRGANPGLSSGVVSLDFNVVTGMFIINAVDDYDTGAYIEIVADLRPGNTTIRYAQDDGTNVNFDQAVAQNTDYSLAINFDTGSDTFSATLNGTPLTVGAQTSIFLQKWS